MNEDYVSASKRHLDDAHNLNKAGRWDNAGYLAGYVGECGAKAVIQLAGCPPHLHVDRLSPRVLALAADVSLATRRYRMDLDPNLETLRSQWRADLRYAKTGSISQSAANVLLKAAMIVFARTIEAMILDGVLERMPT
jgi:hypothetical protein